MVTSVSSASGFNPLEMMKQMRQKMFEEADSDGDGSLSKAELEAQISKMEEQRKAEGVSGPRGGNGPSADQMLKDFDSDGDGNISQTEYDSGFAKLDEQMQSQLVAMQGQGFGPPPPPPGEGAAAYGRAAGQVQGGGGGGQSLIDLLNSLSDEDDDDSDSSSDDSASTSASSSDNLKLFLDELKRYTEASDGSTNPRDIEQHMAGFIAGLKQAQAA
ncbi:EF-hand domain-containing protein [Ferrovibrio sp.]|uniref:EF-hand domain-containing protein n=1 Tax=Ferrovibrio sp. TaxID=1917215 RepID=UPI003D26EDD8